MSRRDGKGPPVLAFTCYDCGDTFVYREEDAAERGPTMCDGCSLEYCYECAQDQHALFDMEAVHGVQEESKARGRKRAASGASARYNLRRRRHVPPVIELAQCTACTHDPDLAEVDSDRLLNHALQMLGWTRERMQQSYLAADAARRRQPRQSLRPPEPLPVLAPLASAPEPEPVDRPLLKITVSTNGGIMRVVGQ